MVIDIKDVDKVTAWLVGQQADYKSLAEKLRNVSEDDGAVNAAEKAQLIGSLIARMEALAQTARPEQAAPEKGGLTPAAVERIKLKLSALQDGAGNSEAAMDCVSERAGEMFAAQEAAYGMAIVIIDRELMKA